MAITIDNVGKLIASKGNLKVFEKLVPGTRYGEDYRVLTSFKDGKLFKQVISGEPLTTNEMFHSAADGFDRICTSGNKKNLRSIPSKVRDMWNSALKDMGWFSSYGEIKLRALPQGHKTIAKNFETGDITTIIKANSYVQSYGRPEYVGLHSTKTKRNGKVTKEFGQVSVRADEGVIMDKSKRTYIKNESSPEGTVTLESGLRGSKFDGSGYGNPFKEQRGNFYGRQFDITDNTVKISVPANEYNPTLHYISYHV